PARRRREPRRGSPRRDRRRDLQPAVALDRAHRPYSRSRGIIPSAGDTLPAAMDVVTFGETMVLFAAAEQGPLRFASTYTRHAAGTESNFAIGLARLGHRVGWFSRVGDDEFGQYIVNTVRGEGVDTSRVIVDPEAPTGVLFKEKRELGPRKIVYYRRGSAASRLAPGDLDGDYIAAARYLHLTGITPALSERARETVFAAAELARARGVR